MQQTSCFGNGCKSFKVQSIWWFSVIDSTNWDLAKNQLPSICPDPIVILSFAQTCKREQLDRLLCLIRALKFYLKMTSSYHQNRTRLFLPPTSVAQLDAPSDWRPGGRGFNPCRGRQHSFMEIDHEIFSTVILSLLLIQEGQLSVSGERMCTILVNRLED